MSEPEKTAEKQVQALCTQMGALTTELQAALQRVERLEKGWAIACLQLLDRAWTGTAEEGFADLLAGKTDHRVLALVIGHHQHPLDTCAACGRPAPCTGSPAICSWGCAK